MKLSTTNMPGIPDTHRGTLVLCAENRADAKLLGVLDRLLRSRSDIRDGLRAILDSITERDEEAES